MQLDPEVDTRCYFGIHASLIRNVPAIHNKLSNTANDYNCWVHRAIKIEKGQYDVICQ